MRTVKGDQAPVDCDRAASYRISTRYVHYTVSLYFEFGYY